MMILNPGDLVIMKDSVGPWYVSHKITGSRGVSVYIDKGTTLRYIGNFGDFEFVGEDGIRAYQLDDSLARFRFDEYRLHINSSNITRYFNTFDPQSALENNKNPNVGLRDEA